MDGLFEVLLSFTFAVTFCVLAYLDFKTRTVPTHGVLLMLGLGMLIGLTNFMPIKLYLAVALMFLGVLQKVLRKDWLPWGDILVLTSLAMAIPAYSFGFMVFFASGAVFLGAAKRYILRESLQDYRVPFLPLLVAGLFLTLFIAT